MGSGKRPGPGGGQKPEGRCLTKTEIYAELVHNGVTLAEIASMTDSQIKELYFRPRDECGRLKSDGMIEVSTSGVSVEWFGPLEVMKCDKTKDWKKSSFSAAVKNSWRSRGLTEQEAETKWQEYVNLPKNRTLKGIVDRADKVRQMMGR